MNNTHNTKVMVKAWVKSHVQRCRELALVRVKRGKGLLYHRRIKEFPGIASWRDRTDVQSFLYDQRLITAGVTEQLLYESLFLRGSGRGHQDRKEFQAVAPCLNERFVSLRRSLKSLTPVLELLESGDYLIGDYLLAPTYDIYECFWVLPPEVDNNGMLQPFCYYELAGYGTEYHGPFGIIATETPAFLDQERVEYYREKLCQGHETRALAFYLSGGLSLLLDGHQKAMAALSLGKLLPCLVIMKLSEKTSDDYEEKLSAGSQLFYQQGRWGEGNELNYLSDSQGTPIAKLEKPPEFRLDSAVPEQPSEQELLFWSESDRQEVLDAQYVRKLVKRYPMDVLRGLDLIPVNRLRECYHALPAVQFLVGAEERSCEYLNENYEPADINYTNHWDKVVFALRLYLEMEPETKWFSEEEQRRIREIAQARENYSNYCNSEYRREVERIRRVIRKRRDS